MVTALPYLIETLEVIANKEHLDKYPTWSSFDTETRARARSLLCYFYFFTLLTFYFIYALKQ